MVVVIFLVGVPSGCAFVGGDAMIGGLGGNVLGTKIDVVLESVSAVLKNHVLVLMSKMVLS